MTKTQTVALLLLPLTCFMVLEPVKHVLPFDLPILAELCSYLFYLLCIRSTHSASIQHLQDPNLFLGWIPPRPTWMCFHLHEILNFYVIKLRCMRSVGIRIENEYIYIYIYIYREREREREREMHTNLRGISLMIIRGSKLSGATFRSNEALEIERSDSVDTVGQLGSKRA